VPLFVVEYAARAGKSVRVVPEEMWGALRAYDWPGNVRELRNVLERCVLLSDSDVLSGRWLQLPQAARGASGGPGSALDGVHIPLDGSLTLDDMEREIVRAALERAGHNVTAAARLLGTTRQTVRYRIEKFGLSAGAAVASHDSHED